MCRIKWATGLVVLGWLVAQFALEEVLMGQTPGPDCAAYAVPPSGAVAAPEEPAIAATSFEDISNGDGPLYVPPAPVPAPGTSTNTPSGQSASGPSVLVGGAPKPAAAQSAPLPICCQCLPADPTPWKLPQPCVFQRWGITWGGWTQLGATANNWNPPSHFNGPLATNDRNEFQMNQMWLFFDRPVNTSGGGVDVGGHIDLCYGTDWRFGQNFGLENRINSPENLYGLVIPQFYLAVGLDDMTVKMGHFATGFGYEAIPAPMNFFYSHSYALGYTEPLLVTGLQADYRISDQWVVTAGFNRGWMMFEDQNSSLDFVGGVRWKGCDGRRQASFMVTTGPQFVPWFPTEPNEHNRFAYALVFQEQVTDKFLYVIQHNLGTEAGTSLYRPGHQALWYGIAQYFFYQLNAKWKAGLRFEWLRDDDGTRVAGVGNWIGSDAGWTALPGFAGDFFALSLGLNWRPNPNVVFRPEVRWDWYGGTRNLEGLLPFNDGLSARQFTAAVDLVVTY